MTNAPNRPICLVPCAPNRNRRPLVLPAYNTEAIQLHLNEIAIRVNPGAHAVLNLDQAGWHGAKGLKVPDNISLLPLLGNPRSVIVRIGIKRSFDLLLFIPI
jgi:hypothetical protein